MLVAALETLPRVVRPPAELAAATLIGLIWPIETAAHVMTRAVEGAGSGRAWTLSDPTPAQPLRRDHRRVVRTTAVSPRTSSR